MLARRFLYIIATLIGLAITAAILWNLFQDRILRFVFVPSVGWSVPAGPAPDYARASAWAARPDLADDPARWRPPGVAAGSRGAVSVFFVMPTGALENDGWNAPLQPAGDTGRFQRLFVQSEASAFNGIGEIWAPHYRQAVFGAFLTDKPEAKRALDFAYRDVERAFAAFLAGVPADRPILLAGHSQGTLHLMRLMREQVAGTPLAQRVVAAYLVGWPISLKRDVPTLGLPGCVRPDQANCLLSWQSFAEPAETRQFDTLYGASPARDPMLCVNPLSGAPDAAPASANLGALTSSGKFEPKDLKAGVIPARCSPEGWLLIGPPPKGYDGLVFPGNNYHVYDYALFWVNIRKDAERRTEAFLQ